jgi:plasmid replication initiation protein
MEGIEDRATRARHVTMNNALVRAGHGLSLSEKRLVMLAVSKLNSAKVMKPGEVLPSVKVTAHEYARTYGLDPSSGVAYEALKDAAKNLFDRRITFFEPAHKRGKKPLQATIRNEMRWVGRCKYHDGEGWVQFAWWPDLLPCLMGLKRQFTTYKLQQASALRSVYSWKLLELLSRFKSSGQAEYSIEDFKASMEAPPSLSDFAQLKRRVIDPAVQELSAKDGWSIEWEPIKAGRKVNALRFNFTRNALTL